MKPRNVSRLVNIARIRCGRRIGPGDSEVAFVHGNQPADGNAGERIEEGKHSLEYRASDILEIDVNTFRAGRRKTADQIRCPMVDAGVEAEFVGHVTAFLWSSGDADGVGALDAGDLADNRTDRTRSGRDHDGLASGRLPDLK